MKTFTVNVFGVIFLVTMLAGCMNTIPEPLLTNPYPNYPYWYKAQVHVHSDRSAPDSYETPKEVLQEYKDAGYQIIALTDHDASCEDIFTDPGVPGIVYIPSEEDCYSSAEHLLAIGLTGEYPYPEGEVGCGPQCGWDSNQEQLFVSRQKSNLNWGLMTRLNFTCLAYQPIRTIKLGPMEY